MVKNNTKKRKPGTGGARKGAGKPKGSTHAETKRKRMIAQEYREKIREVASDLFISQLSVAKGNQYLFKIETVKYKKNGKWHEEKKKPQVVDNPEEIERYLTGDYDDKSEYYFMTTERPDNKAIDSMLDRAFGKAKENINIKDDEQLYEAKQKAKIAERIIARRERGEGGSGSDKSGS